MRLKQPSVGYICLNPLKTPVYESSVKAPLSFDEIKIPHMRKNFHSTESCKVQAENMR